MAFDRFLIAPVNTGLQKNSPPWLQPDDAFETLQNAYMWRQRLRKRYGSRMMGISQLNTRLRISLASGGAAVGITDVAGAAAGNLRTILADASFPMAVGQIFSIGSQIYTVTNPANGVNLMLNTGPGTGTFDLNPAGLGPYAFLGAPPLTPIFFYPTLPVMGITQYEIGAVNNHPTYAFDTRYAYLFAAGGWDRSGTAVWHGTDLNYFWAANWQSIDSVPILFVTNFNATVPAPAATDDPIWYLNNATWTAASGANAFYFRPNGGAIHTGPYVKTARIILPFKNRLLLLNTVENDNSGGAGVNTAFTNRCRYSFYGSPLAPNAWYEKNQQDNVPNVAGGAGFIDAATEEQIIGAEFIKDRLIVYFERSTWEIVYTGNQVLPFVWQKINTELGSMSTFSTIPFDKQVFGIGQSGIHACSGQNVVRIDDKIPNQIFEFVTTNNAPIRTAGVRDYYTELVYWAYVGDLKTPTQKFPNQILVYNYKNQSWSINDDCATTFGYFEQIAAMTWASSAPITWQQAGFMWNSNVVQPNQRQILYGTPEGFVLIINPEEERLAPSMQITNMTFAASGIVTLTIIDHNLTDKQSMFVYDQDFILIENVVADAPTMATLNGNIFPVNSVIDKDTITIDTGGRNFSVPPILPLFSGTYNGGGTAARVSNIQILSKQWNPYVGQDSSFYLAKIDFAVVKTPAGEITVDYFASSSSSQSMVQDGQGTGAIMGNSVLETHPYDPAIYPFEQVQDLLWHPVMFQSFGTFVQIGMSFSLEQMYNPNISLSPFEIQALALYTQQLGRMQ